MPAAGSQAQIEVLEIQESSFGDAFWCHQYAPHESSQIK